MRARTGPWEPWVGNDPGPPSPQRAVDLGLRAQVDGTGARKPPATAEVSSRSRCGTLARMTEVTRILSAIEHGDPRAAEQLLPLVYDELRQLAAQKLAHERPGLTLQPTALVHEAYLRLVAGGDAPGPRDPS